MEKIIYDMTLEDVIEIIEQRIELYENLIILDKTHKINCQVVDELNSLIEILEDLKYYKEE